LERAEGLPLEHRTNFRSSCGDALAKDQLADLPVEWGGRLVQVPLELLLALELGHPGEVVAGELQESGDLVVDISSPGRGRQLFSGEQLRDIRFGDLGGGRQILLLEPELDEPLSNQSTDVHRPSRPMENL